MSWCTSRTASRDYGTPCGSVKPFLLQPSSAPRAGIVRERKSRVRVISKAVRYCAQNPSVQRRIIASRPRIQKTPRQGRTLEILFGVTPRGGARSTCAPRAPGQAASRAAISST